MMPREPDDAGRPRRDARGGHGPLRRGQPGPALAGLRDARPRPVRPDEPERRDGRQRGQRRHRSDAGLLVAAGEQRDVELLRRPKGNTLVPVNAKIYVGRLPGPLDADRGHRPGHEPRRDAANGEPRQHGAVRAEPERTRAGARTTSSRSHPATAWCGSTYERPGARRGSEHHDPLRRRTSRRRRRARRSPATPLGTNTNLANVQDDNEATNDGQTGANVATAAGS